LRPEVVAALRQAILRDELRGDILPVPALTQRGLMANFDENNLEFFVDIPPHLRRAEVIDFREMGTATGKLFHPAKTSAYLNLFANQEYAFQDTVVGSQEGRLPLAATFDTAVNHKSWVLEGSANYLESGNIPWRRNDVRLVKDSPDEALRFTAGDLSYQTMIFQQQRPMGGLSLAKNFALQPYTLTVPMTRNEFVLRAPSTLQIYVNERPFQRMDLPAGSFDVRNLPLGAGLNDVRYEIIDPSGKVESVQLPFNSDPESLRRGLHQYSYNFGFASTPERATYKYHSDLFTGSAFHRYGFNDRFTGGLSMQGDRRQYVHGLESLYASSLGTFGIDLARSQVRYGVSDFAARFRYLYRDYLGGEGSQRSLLFSTETQGPRFATLGNLQPNNAAIYTAALNYSQQIIANIGAGLGGSYTKNRAILEGYQDSYLMNYTLGKSWRGGWNSSLIASHGKNIVGQTQKSIFFLLSFQIPDSGHSVSYTLNTPNHSNRVDWRYISPKRSNQWNANAGVEKSSEQNLVDSQIGYVHHRGELSLAHQAVDTSAGNRRQSGRLRVASALSYADGNFGMSRPIADSFAFVVKPAAWKGEELPINPGEDDSYETIATDSGPGIIPGLSSYTQSRVRVDSAKLSDGLTLGTENYTLLPTYKSGTVLEVGSDATVYGYGKILSPEGKPLELGFGQIYFVDEPDRAPVEFFTNRAGDFQADGLKPGHYEIRGLSEFRKPLAFSIPEGTRGIVNLGDLGGKAP
jgi:outer membrane usher protein